MSRVRVHNFTISLDGFGTGDGLTRDAPFGHAGERLHQWMFATGFWHDMIGGEGGSSGVDDVFARRFEPGIGAEIMGAGKYGYPGWHEDPDWTGWWGPNPPFHTPVIVLTHHVRPPVEMGGGTVFTFLDAPPDGKLLCDRCETMALALGMPSADSLVGRHVHRGKVVAVQTCCVGEPS